MNVNSLNLHSNEGFLLSFKKPNLNKLRAEAYSVILEHHAEGHENIKAQFRICFWRKKYLMISRIIYLGTDKETNKAITINRGTNAISKYLIAQWKFDHAQSHEIEWNVVTFECDGSSVRMNTSFDESVLKAAEKDIMSGILDRSLKGIGGFIHSVTIGGHWASPGHGVPSMFGK